MYAIVYVEAKSNEMEFLCFSFGWNLATFADA